MGSAAAFIGIVLSLSGAPLSGASEGLAESDRRALGALQEASRQALLAGEPAGAAAIVGRAAIQAFWREGPSVNSFEIDIGEMGADGRLGYVRGAYVMTILEAAGTELEISGKFLQVLRRQADGRWLIRVDMFSPDAQP